MLSKMDKMKKSRNVANWAESLVCVVLSVIFSIGLLALFARIMDFNVCTWNKYRVAFLVILFSFFLYKVLRKKEDDKMLDKSLEAL